MQSFETPGNARMAIMDYMIDHSSTLKLELRNRIRELSTSPSPVDQIARTCELLYARRDEVGEAGRDLCASLASYCSVNGFYGMAEDGRGDKITQAMRRQNGETPPEGFQFITEDQDPAPKPELVFQASNNPTPAPTEGEDDVREPVGTPSPIDGSMPQQKLNPDA